MLDAKTARLHLIFGALCSAAFWVSRRLPALR